MIVWYVRHPHMFGGPLMVGSYATDVGVDGRLANQPLPDDVIDQCASMPGVFRREEEADAVTAEAKTDEPETTEATEEAIATPVVEFRPKGIKGVSASSKK